jgi:UDP-N-acetylmuramoyl-L-alanyl-D-glutamate--2,6-diaminopimelate ligase
MMLTKLLDRVEVRKLYYSLYGQMVVTHDLRINRIKYDSRKIERGDMFVALKGSTLDGSKFVNEAMHNGAAVVVLEDDSAYPDSLFMHTGVAKLVVPNARIALAQLSLNYYDNPSKQLRMVGVTGTNGKTTVTHLLRQLLERSGSKTGLIGTIEYVIGDRHMPATHTTPESLELQALLAEMRDSGCSSAVMEVSSHALDQRRVYGIEYHTSVFTNLTQDHLDYHGSMESYYRAKKLLFEGGTSTWSVINTDDEYGTRLYNDVKGSKISYGISTAADVRVADIKLSSRQTTFTVEYKGVRTSIETPLLGRFNVYNTLAAFAAGSTLGFSAEFMRDTLREVSAVPGRFERVLSPAGWLVIIDYAHTPDALQKVLAAIHDLNAGAGSSRIITVFGCGGNRDTKKRPIMARIASEMSAITIVTSDNPRHEDPQAIIDDIMKGVAGGSEVYTEVDRTKAITMALDMAKPGDVVLLAGKGHEDYQIIGDKKIHLSDREIVQEYLGAHA